MRARKNDAAKTRVTFVDGVPVAASGHPAQPIQRAIPPAVSAPAPMLEFDTPDAWVRVPPGSAMRVAQYRVPRASPDGEDADLAVYYFGPRGAGEVEETFERWADAFEPGAKRGVTRSEIVAGKTPVYIVEVDGVYRGDMSMGATSDAAAELRDARLLGAIVMSPTGPYYFKMLGPRRTVESAREAFVNLLRGVRPARER